MHASVEFNQQRNHINICKFIRQSQEQDKMREQIHFPEERELAQFPLQIQEQLLEQNRLLEQ